MVWLQHVLKLIVEVATPTTGDREECRLSRIPFQIVASHVLSYLGGCRREVDKSLLFDLSQCPPRAESVGKREMKYGQDGEGVEDIPEVLLQGKKRRKVAAASSTNLRVQQANKRLVVRSSSMPLRPTTWSELRKSPLPVDSFHVPLE